MKVIYSCVFLVLGFTTCAFGQDKCKAKIDYTITEGPSNTYSIALQSAESLNNPEIELFDLYQGKTIQKKQTGDGLRSKKIVFTNVKPSLYILYVKQNGCAKTQSVGGINGIKVGNKE
jgi:hypothetical protein